MKRIILSLICVVLLASLSACGSTNQGAPAAQSPALQAPVLPSSDIAYELASSSGVEVKEFKLGEGELQNALGATVPCPLDGILAVPQGTGPFPLVVMFHGVTSTESVYDTTYAGFNYLAKQLAAEGYAALSFNLNVEYDCFKYGESLDFAWAYSIYQQQLALLGCANAGDDPGYGIDLTGKIDFDNLHFIGHSRGGELADSFIRREQTEGLSRIKSLIRVEATRALYDEPEPDIPIGIIIGEYDGDVPEDGQSVFDAIQKEQGRTSPASLVFLRGANHAYFNREFLGGDESRYGDTAGKLLTREQQEDFLMHYAATFLSVYAKAEAAPSQFDVRQAQPDTMFGYPVTASFYQPGRVSLLTVSEAGAAQLPASGAAEIRYTVQTAPYGILFTHPGATHNDGELPLYNIRWTAKGGTVTIPVNADLSGRRAVSLYVAVDSSDALNPRDTPQSFTVTLKDASGASQSVVVPQGTSALAYHSGFAEHIEATEWSPDYSVWTGYMPLGELRIPLSYFDAISLGTITEIVVGLDQTETGSMMLSGVYSD